MMFDDTLTKQDVLALVSLASKACLLAEEIDVPDKPLQTTDIKFIHQPVARLLFVAAAKQVRPILAKMDKTYPGMIPVPHDGKAWRVRNE